VIRKLVEKKEKERGVKDEETNQGRECEKQG
jgi:hypothetical protein